MDSKRLISKIDVVYDLLHKLPLDLDFYKKYYEYKILAIEIEKLMKIDKEVVIEDKDSFEFFAFNTLYGYVHFKVFPLFNFIEENKEILFLEFPEDDILKEVKYSFLKLGKMEDDTRYEYWLFKTNTIFDEFLSKIKTTKKGNDLFIETNIMNAIPEIDELYKRIQKDRKNKMTYLERIEENDTYGLVKQVKELGMEKKPEFSISLRDKGNTDYLGFYESNKLTKEEMLEPVELFQSLIKLKLEDKDDYMEMEDSVLFDSESSKITCNGNEIKITKSKDIYYIIKYLFERNNTYEECFYDEIREYSELNDGKKRSDKNLYDSLMQFNKRLINKGIKDLFVINFHSIKIKDKYKIVTL